jgi:type IV secretory pathway VirB10-like protein
LELKARSHQITSTTADTSSLAENAASPPLEQSTLSEVESNQVFNSALSQKPVHLADLEASNPALPPLEATAHSAAVGLLTNSSASTPPQQQKQPNHRRLQPVEILTSAGDWVAGYFVHSCIAVANLIGIEQKFTLFDADGGAYTFLGQVRPLSILFG